MRGRRTSRSRGEGGPLLRRRHCRKPGRGRRYVRLVADTRARACKLRQMSTALENYPLLATISSPADLRRLGLEKLPELCRELREFLIHSVATRGGHFAAGLGTVELTVALHYVFDTPRDRLVWDVGHQAYPHKVLTGRRDQLHTIKQRGGLAPFTVTSSPTSMKR